MDISEDEYLSDDSYDSDEVDVIDNIYIEDEEYWERPIEKENLVLGLSTRYYHNNKYDYILLNKVSSKTFFKYLYEDIQSFLRFYSIIRPRQVEVDIIKINFIKDNEGNITYQCVLKTHYIRLIQRNWRRVMNEREIIWKRRMNPKYLFERQIYGKWNSPEIRSLPGLYGMMSNLQEG